MQSGISLCAGWLLTATCQPLVAATLPPAWWIVGVVSALLACGLVYFLVGLQRTGTRSSAPSVRREPVCSPFDELIDRHGLSSAEVELLRKAATQLDLSRPVILFVNPSLLGQFAECSEFRAAALALRRKLFGDQCESSVDAAIDDVAANLLGDLSTVESGCPDETPDSTSVELVQ